MANQYLDKRGLQTLCNSLKTLINTKPGYEYSSISIDGGATLKFMVNESKYCKLILHESTTDSTNYLAISVKNNSGSISRQIAYIPVIDISRGIEIELMGLYTFVKIPRTNEVITDYRGVCEQLVFNFNSNSSSDRLDFVYKLEV